jgi:predicted DNA-binding transcriptional regulator AlpA
LATVKGGRWDRPVVHHLVGTAEIAEMLGVSRQRVHQLSRREDFPAPVAVLSAGSIWEREAVDVWLAAQRDLEEPR